MTNYLKLMMMKEQRKSGTTKTGGQDPPPIFNDQNPVAPQNPAPKMPPPKVTYSGTPPGCYHGQDATWSA